MEITLNGKAYTLDGEMTVAALIGLLGINVTTVVAELNEEVVDRAAFDVTVIRAHDVVELLQFVGGG